MNHFLKIALAGATICAVAFGVATFGPTGEVASSEADVLSFDWFQTRPSARFVNALEQLGHEEPRVYKMGRETVYFSARPAAKDPQELIEEYQRTFVDHGVNGAIHTDVTPVKRRGASGILRGEVMLLESSANSVTMGGGVLRGLPESQAELDAVMDRAAGTNFNDMVRGIRYVRAQKLEGQTVVTAVWTDDDFDIRKANAPQPSDPDLPACRGCVARSGFETVKNDLDRRIVRYTSQESVRDVEAFYDRALAQRGWVLEGNPGVGELRYYMRKDRRLSLSVQAGPRFTNVMGVIGD